MTDWKSLVPAGMRTGLAALAVAVVASPRAEGQLIQKSAPDLAFSVIDHDRDGAGDVLAPLAERGRLRLLPALEQRAMQEYDISVIPDDARIVSGVLTGTISPDWGAGSPQWHDLRLAAYFADGQASIADFQASAAVLGTSTIFFGESWQFQLPLRDVVQTIVASGTDWIGFRARSTTNNDGATFHADVSLVINWTPDPCQGDLTTTAVPGQAGYGVADGIVNNEDFFYYLTQFAAENKAVCDLTYGAVPGQFGYALPNGILNNDDFFYFLMLFSRGC